MIENIEINTVDDLIDFLSKFSGETLIKTTWEGIVTSVKGYEYEEESKTLFLDVDVR